jgi:hypothetical protein
MTKLVFQTKEYKLVSHHTIVLCETLQEITDTIVAYKRLNLPREITVSLRVDPFEDDNDDMMSIAGCNVTLNLIEMRVPPCFTIKTLVAFIHELIHIGQGQDGYLREVDNGFVWFDRFFSIEGLTFEQYLELPWERQAFREQSEIWGMVRPHITESLNEHREQPDESIKINVVN